MDPRGAFSRGRFQRLPIEDELLQEMAEALGRTGTWLERWLERCRVLGEDYRRLEGSLREKGGRPQRQEGGSIQELSGQLEEVRGELKKALVQAEKYLYYLIIQREAIGFRSHRTVRERYPFPHLPGLQGEGPRP